MNKFATDITDYVLASGIESGGVGVKLFVRLSRPLTSNEESEALRTVQGIHRAIEFETARQDPRSKTQILTLEKEFQSMFRQAGLNPVFSEIIPNEYCSKICCHARPWFIISCEIGHVKIGWRKRVINIDWTRTLANYIPVSELFPNEDVTKDEGYIHAWGQNKVVQYLQRLREAVEKGAQLNKNDSPTPPVVHPMECFCETCIAEAIREDVGEPEIGVDQGRELELIRAGHDRSCAAVESPGNECDCGLSKNVN